MSSYHIHKPHKQLNGFSLYFSVDVAILVIDRGENRINSEFVDTFNIFLDDVESNESCKGLITTGAGKYYGNGLDLEWMLTLSGSNLTRFILTIHELLKRILYFPLLTVAALNGHTYAGGALFAFAHDLRTFRVDKGWICFNEVFIERRFKSFHMFYLRTKIGNGKNLSDALVLGRRYTAEEAFNCGLVHAVSTETMLITESVRLLKSFSGKAGYPRQSLSDMKKDVYSDALEAYAKDIQELEEIKSKL
uniref:Uncharacterized protein n=1 Tax=Arion vulgaris TaxID=1028688 RepID=A0A0B6YA29_9EUPU